MKFGFLIFLLLLPQACQNEDEFPANQAWVNAWQRGQNQARVDDTGEPIPFVCIGVEVPESAYTLEPGPLKPVEPEEEEPADTGDTGDTGDGDADSGELPGGDDGIDDTPSEPVPAVPEEEPEVDACEAGLATCVGSSAPAWLLEDFQPQSCGYEATYGMEAFKGRVTVLVLLAAW